MNKFFSNVAERSARALRTVKHYKHTPKIMMITGIVTLVGSSAYACYQTLKLEDAIDDAKESIDHVKELRDEGEIVVDEVTGETVEYTDSDYRKDMFHAYASGVWGVGKLYLPSVVGATFGIGLICGSDKILTDNLAETTLALTYVSDKFSKYRRNVINDQGQEADRRYMVGLETKKNLEMHVIDPETGEIMTKNEKKIDVVMDTGNIASPYALILNDCKFWTSDPNYNVSAIQAKINILNAQLKRDHYIHNYDIYETFGALQSISPEAIAMSHQSGLIEGYGDDEIKIELIPTHLGSEDIFKEILLMDINAIGGWEVNGKYVPFNDLVASRAWLDREL